METLHVQPSETITQYEDNVMADTAQIMVFDSGICMEKGLVTHSLDALTPTKSEVRMISSTVGVLERPLEANTLSDTDADFGGCSKNSGIGAGKHSTSNGKGIDLDPVLNHDSPQEWKSPDAFPHDALPHDDSPRDDLEYVYDEEADVEELLHALRQNPNLENDLTGLLSLCLDLEVGSKTYHQSAIRQALHIFHEGFH